MVTACPSGPREKSERWWSRVLWSSSSLTLAQHEARKRPGCAGDSSSLEACGERSKVSTRGSSLLGFSWSAAHEQTATSPLRNERGIASLLPSGSALVMALLLETSMAVRFWSWWHTHRYTRSIIPCIMEDVSVPIV
jgi:hypothetical protein